MRLLLYLLVFTGLVAGFSACASSTPENAKPDGQEQEKGKPSEPFRY